MRHIRRKRRMAVNYFNILRLFITVTYLTLIFCYLLFVHLTFPQVCWLKHRPSIYDRHTTPSVDVVTKRPSYKHCSNLHNLTLMPMPSQVTLSEDISAIRIPSEIRIETDRPLPFPISITSTKSAFVLSIDYQANTDDFYPFLGIDESYELNISAINHASLYAKTRVGILRGLATFEQLRHHETIPIPLSIVDQPRFPWRGLMLDVARHFIPIDIVKQTIDWMQFVKMNVLHLHLSDDQGFRVESKRFPRLHDREQFYTQSDIQQLVDYARQRAIRIVPEFDMPAHTTAWFVGYPQLAALVNVSYQLETRWGVMNATMDVIRESTYHFLEEFFEEMIKLFPDKYFHTGGDECEPYDWLKSPETQAFIHRENLLDHHGMQAYFTRRIGQILQKYNRTMMGWDEISTANLSLNTIIQTWRDRLSLLDVVRRGYRAVLSAGFYLDHMASAGYHYENDPRAIPFITEQEKENILGGEACLWTEYISASMVHSRLWPRTAAIAERLWSSTCDTVNCMYDRLATINRRFFHPDDNDYMDQLSTMATNVRALRRLADMCQPLGLQGRDRKRNYTSRTPLNRFVDILRPESEQARQLSEMTDLSTLHSAFASWKMNHQLIETNDIDILQLSNNLAQLGQLGLRLLTLLDRNQQRSIVSANWLHDQYRLLDTYEWQVAEIRLAGVDPIRKLLTKFDFCSFDFLDLSLILFCSTILMILVYKIRCIRRRYFMSYFNNRLHFSL